MAVWRTPIKSIWMENRIDSTFCRLRRENKKGLIAYICAGDPSFRATAELIPALEEAGVDLVELGVPFSDPLADGVVNQMAAQRALEAGATVKGLFEMVASVRERTGIPLVLFTYLNPLYQFGLENFHKRAMEVGVDGVLVLDLPPDETALATGHGKGLHWIRLIAPTTGPERIRLICQSGEGFIYYVSREGVTGEQNQMARGLAGRVAMIKEHTDLPVAVGFGISTPEQAAEVAGYADAVVVGSAIVRRIEAAGKDPALVENVIKFVEPIARAVHGVS